MKEVLKKYPAGLYDDLIARGGLGSALQRELRELGSSLFVPTSDFDDCAQVENARRESNITLAAEVRRFHGSFWDRGVMYGSGWSETLQDIARAIVGFQSSRFRIEEVFGAFPWIEMTEDGPPHEQGRLVQYRWETYESPTADLPSADLRPLIIAAGRHEELRRLLPFTSHDHLCFSRTTGYPYPNDCPTAYPIGPGLYRVDARDPAGWRTVGEGDADEAARMLVRALPANVGAAVDGTAEDLA